MTIAQMHVAWTAHVRELPQESPVVDVKLGQVACPTLPFMLKRQLPALGVAVPQAHRKPL